jgi:hypothetical protein
MNYELRCRDEICAGGPAVNEDLIGRAQTAAWVVDGVSGVTGRRIVGEASDAAWLATTLDAALRQEFAAPQSDADAALQRVSSRISDAFFAIGVGQADDRAECPCACLALLSLVENRVQTSCIGDCRVIAERSDGGLHIAADTRVERFETSLLKELIDRMGREPDIDPKIALAEKFRAMRGFLNRDDGYWVVHPTIGWLRGLQQTVTPAFSGQTALLVSDGFYRLVNLFGAHTDCSLLAAAKEHGLNALLKTLRELEDRHSIEEYPRIKRHDDASACLVEVATDG